MKNYGLVDEHTPLTKTLPPDYVYMTNPNRLFRKQVHQFQCCICAVVLAIFGLAIAVTVLYSVDNDTIDNVPILPTDNTSLQLLLSKPWPLPDAGVPEWQMDPPTPEEVETAVSAGKSSLAAKDEIEASNPSLPVNSPSYRHQVSIKTSAKATNLARSAYIMEEATKQFVLTKTKSKNYTKSVGRGLKLSTDWLPADECGQGPPPACLPSQYRSIDGTCNNPYKATMWGVAMRPYRRQLPPDYADGISKPRAASDGSPLPSARSVSVTVHRPVYRDDPNFTVMLAVWGQFMDHDVTAFALSLGAGGKPISCCQNSSLPAHPECFPVHLDENDPYYQQFGITCMEFVRSAPAPTCSMGPREQMNQVSSYLDASVVYGNTPELSRSLRSYQGGQLKMLVTPDGRTLLPISTNLEDGCNREAENAKGRYCFMTGDTRANENTHLTSLHLLMARQHNLIASSLSDLNPEWNDEKLYQETRKIVAAQMQHITYKEFLPVLLGPELMSQLDLNPQEDGYYENYDPYVDATISNNFATSAFRFAHTLLPALMKTVAKDWGSEESIEMHKMLFDPFKLYQAGSLDKVLQGAINTRLERADSYFNTEFTQKLFQASEDDEAPSAPRYGLDLVSLNIQRGRDHGLPAYPQWREFCGLSRPKTFADMVGMVDEGSLEKIKSLYKSVDDIDMYTGALSEFPIEGGLVGPTITCLVTDQFKRLKQGDSFWYETNKQPQAFTQSQLNEIRKTSLAGIICDTSDEVTTVQPEVMRSTSPTNTRVSCSSLPRLDLTKWIETTSEKEMVALGKKPKSFKMQVSVTSGIIKTNKGEILWDGTIPVSIPLPVFSDPLKKAAPGVSPFGHGVQWQGVISTTPSGIDFTGIFSYPIYTHGPVPLFANYTIKWVNGEFKFSSTVTSSDIDITQSLLPGNYESPIYFSEKKVDFAMTTKTFFLGATEDDSPLVIGEQKMPLILIGSYSLDRASFLWSGNATITIPTATVTPPVLASAKSGIKAPSISGLFNIASGIMKLDSADGSSIVIWNGELPAAIAIPMPNKVVSAAKSGEQYPVLGSGVVWSASVSENSLDGTFSFPQFNRSFGFLQVNWLRGQFSVDVVPLMLNATLDQLLVPGIKYSSRIILRQEMIVTPLEMNDIMDTEVDAPGSIEKLIVESQEVIDGIVKAPLILHGNFSPDKTTFYFNGKVILAVRPTKPKMDKQLQLLKSPELSFPLYPWASPKYGGIVNSGHITAGLNGASPSTIWSGTLPVAIPMASFFSPMFDSLGGKSFLFGNGIVWSGTVTGSTIKGTFSLPQTTWSMSGITQQTWNGEFAFEINPIWSATFGTMFVQGVKYYSKINFQGSQYEPGISTLTGVPGEDPSVAMSAPVILQGVYSLDKQTFYWSGGFIIKFCNKPVLAFQLKGFKVPKEPSAVRPKSSIEIDVSSGSVVGGFVGDSTKQTWAGKLPATIPYSNLMSMAETWKSVPTPNIMWSGEVVNQTFQGSFAVPTYKLNGTSEMVLWWVGNFSFAYTTKWNQLENFIKPGKKYNFDVMFQNSQSSSMDSSYDDNTQNSVLKFTQAAQKAVGDAKSGKLIVFGKYYSKPFYCYVIPFCDEKKEFYWNGRALLVFPDPPKNPTSVELKMSAEGDEATSVGLSTQFGGKIISGSIRGGVGENIKNVWWSGELPVQIPTSIFWTNKTKAPIGLIGGRTVEWSGAVTGNTLKGTFTFPQLVQNFPMPTLQWWSGEFSFDIQPLWNKSLVGLIQSGITYSSGIHFQGVKLVDNNDEGKQFVLGAVDSFGVKKKAPIVLKGSISPDGSSFLWSGDFIMAVKNYPYPTPPQMAKEKAQLGDDTSPPIQPPTPSIRTTPVKPKLSVSFTVITGDSYATNGSEAVRLWGGAIPVDINTDMFNPTNTPGAGVSVSWTPDSIAPDLTGTFSVTVYSRNDSVVRPVHWTGNFSMHYLIKWSGALEGLVEPGSTYSCNIKFIEPAVKKSVQGSPGYIDSLVPQKFVLGAVSTPCTLIVNGKSYTKNESPFYCNLVPFMCSNKPPSNWFSFNGDALLIFKPQTKMSPKDLPMTDNPVIPNAQLATPRRINTTVISGSIIAAPETESPKVLWSGNLPINISLPVFWDSEDASNAVVPPNDTVHAHGVIWSGYQMGPRMEGTFSLPQYIKRGMKWWTGRFSFLFQTDWGMLGDLDSLIRPNVKYNSKILFRDIHSPMPLLTPSQFDADTAYKMPIILLGTYSANRKDFFWNGNLIIDARFDPWNFINKLPNLQFVSGPKPSKPKSKPGSKPQRVGLLVSKGSLTKISSDGNSSSVWAGVLPAQISQSTFNISKGANVIWTASTLTPKFTGNFTMPLYLKDSDGFKVEWINGDFSFDLTTLWSTSLDVIEIGKQYATVFYGNTSKQSKADKANQISSIMDLIVDSAPLTGSQLSTVNLKGTLSPDKMFFNWLGEAWFSIEKNSTNPMKMSQAEPIGKQQLSFQFGGAVTDGWVTSGSSSFFSFSNTIWSGSLPAVIPFSSFWSPSIFGGSKLTHGVTWSATSVTDSVIKGTYSVPQITWSGITTSVSYYSGEFQFSVRPLWMASLISFIQPGMQYYSKVNFQGGPPGLLQDTAGSLTPGIKAPIILQGTYSPDYSSFSWSGNFIINLKVK